MKITAYLKENEYSFINSIPEHRTRKINYSKKTVSNDYLKGDITTYTYRGFCCLGYNFEILKDCHERIIIDSEFIQISFALSGKSMVLDKRKPMKMKSGNVMLAYLNEHTVDIKMLKKEKKVNHIRFIISKSFFLEMMKIIDWNVKESFLSKIINGEFLSFGNVEISAEMELLSSLKAIFENEYAHPVDNIFLKNKITEILIRIHHLFESKENYANAEQASLNEIQQLEKAKKFIEKNYANPPTIRDLSRTIYLNEFKLKKGFKQLFGCTVHEYVTNIRMKKAKEFLSKNLQVSEVGNLLGYKTSSHFIQSFKNYFGHTPKQLKIIIFMIAERVIMVEY